MSTMAAWRVCAEGVGVEVLDEAGAESGAESGAEGGGPSPVSVRSKMKTGQPSASTGT